MFELSSKYYDVIYSLKNYEHEADTIRRYILKVHRTYTTILDVACGTGEHAFYLKDTFAVDGIDLNPQFVRIAQEKNPEGRFEHGDMTNFSLNKQYDVVMCLFSSIGYVQTVDNVVKTLTQFKNHLADDGMILVEPWFTPDAWSHGRVDTLTTEKNGIKMCRMSFSEKRDRLSMVRFDYLFGSSSGIEHFNEEHSLGLFTVEEMKQAFVAAGLDVTYEEPGISGRGLYIGRKQ